MTIAGTKELKDHLTRYLRLVRAGECVIVTSHGKPVAELRPVGGPGASTPLETRLAVLAAEGSITLPERSGLPSFRPARVAGEPVSASILRDRR